MDLKAGGEELIEEQAKLLMVENEDVGVKQFAVIEKDIIDFRPDKDVKQLTLNVVTIRCDEQVYRQFLQFKEEYSH